MWCLPPVPRWVAGQSSWLLRWSWRPCCLAHIIQRFKKHRVNSHTSCRRWSSPAWSSSCVSDRAFCPWSTSPELSPRRRGRRPAAGSVHSVWDVSYWNKPPRQQSLSSAIQNTVEEVQHKVSDILFFTQSSTSLSLSLSLAVLTATFQVNLG